MWWVDTIDRDASSLRRDESMGSTSGELTLYDFRVGIRFAFRWVYFSVGVFTMSPSASTEKVYQGIAASPGVAHGPVFLMVKKDLEVLKRDIPPDRREEEIARFERGLLETRRQISDIRAEIEEKLGEDEAGIFDAHLLVLEDRALIEDTIREVAETGCNIEFALKEVADRYIEAFSKINDAYIRERVTDIRDVTRRLLGNLLGSIEADISQIPDGCILVADDLAPSDTAKLSGKRILALATDLGSRTSHLVIMARTLNIPCVVGLHDFSRLVESKDPVLVDGFTGTVLLNPSERSLFRYGKIKIERAAIEKRFQAVKREATTTKDGIPLTIRLNVEGEEPGRVLSDSGAEGVGLFRTEWLFLKARVFPSEEEQFQAYKRIVQGAAPFPVTIRTLDLGGDKIPHHSLFGVTEENPFMGIRAIRFCLQHPEIFKTQLRAVLRASAFGKVQIMYPMISSCEELVAANAMLEDCKGELKKRKVDFDANIRKGSMIEIPSAAVITDLLAEHCDFFSVGTNDLVQYMLAVDRVNDRVAHLYEPHSPAIIRALKFIFDASRREGLPVGVCGEIAGDPLFASLLFGMGATELSLGWGSIPEVKYLLRQMKMEDAHDLATDVLKCRTAAEIKSRLVAFYTRTIGIRFPKLVTGEANGDG